MAGLPEHDDVAYVKDALQVAFLLLAGAWLIRAFIKGDGSEAKRAIGAS